MSIEDRPPFSPGPGPARGELHAAPRPSETIHHPVPFICWGIIALSAAVFFLESQVDQLIGLPKTSRMLHGPAVQAGELWRMVTHVIEHGGILHLILNMSVVYTLGMTFERTLGHGIFGVISVVTAMGSAAASLLLSFDVHMLGASGMIIGWGGAILPIATEQGRRSLGTWLVQVAIISFLPGVSWQGHLGGFVFGLLCGLLLKLGRQTFWKLAPFLVVAAVGAALATTHPALHGL